MYIDGQTPGHLEKENILLSGRVKTRKLSGQQKVTQSLPSGTLTSLRMEPRPQGFWQAASRQESS